MAGNNMLGFPKGGLNKDLPQVTNWEIFPMVLNAVTTAPTKGTTILRDVARWRKIGDSMEIRWDYEHTATGTNGSGIYLFALPKSYTMDLTKQVFTVDGQSVVGYGVCSNTAGALGAISVPTTVCAYNATNLSVVYQNNSSTTVIDSRVVAASGGNFQFGNGNIVYNFTAVVPILGWG